MRAKPEPPTKLPPGKSRQAKLERIAAAALVLERARYYGVSGRERSRQWGELRAALADAGTGEKP